MGNKDSISNTFQVAGTLCIVCSLLVSLTAVGLSSKQKNNVLLDKKKNILLVSGFSQAEVKAMDQAEIESFFDEESDGDIYIQDVVINLATGKEVTDKQWDAIQAKTKASSVKEFDQEKIEKVEVSGLEAEDQLSQKIDVKLIGLKSRENYSHVYVVKNKKKSTVDRFVFPVKGKGLWSTLFGYLAVDAGFEKIEGLTFYQHAETPGLGGEVDNPKWKKMWEGRLIYDDSGELPAEYVVKGTVPTDNRNAVDGLSGATITSKGVSSLVRYWLSEDGFGKYIENKKH